MLSALFILCFMLPIITTTSYQYERTTVPYYCRSDQRIWLQGAEVYELVLRHSGSDRLEDNMTCRFQVQDGQPYRYMVSIVEADVAKDASFLLVKDRASTPLMLHDVNVHWSRRVFISRSGSVMIRFSTGAYPKDGPGGSYRIRLEKFSAQDCPPRWRRMTRTHCISPISAVFLGKATNSSGAADYATAQTVCNRLQANLPMPPMANKTDKMKVLRSHIHFPKSIWIGLVSSTVNPTAGGLRWLDNSPQDSQGEIDFVTCRSGFTWSGGSACSAGEQFGLLRPTRRAYVLMELPSAKHQFACSAPVGGATQFFPVSTTNKAALIEGPRDSMQKIFILLIMICALLGLLILLLFVKIGLRIKRRNAAQGQPNQGHQEPDQEVGGAGGAPQGAPQVINPPNYPPQ